MPRQYPSWPPRSVPPRISVEFRANAAFMSSAENAARQIVQQVARAVKEEARRRVSPGVGPGPHPHRTRHEDTGRLRDSIFYRSYERKNLVGFLIGTPLHYGLYLELGWHTRNGKFYRYPWLLPALRARAGDAFRTAIAFYKL